MSGAVPGTLRVSNDCIADLAGYAALECYGVVGMAEIDQEAGVAACDGRVTIDMHVIVEQGVNMASVVRNLTSSVTHLVKQIAELQSVDVKVHIEGLRASR